MGHGPETFGDYQRSILGYGEHTQTPLDIVGVRPEDGKTVDPSSGSPIDQITLHVMCDTHGCSHAVVLGWADNRHLAHPNGQSILNRGSGKIIHGHIFLRIA